MSADLLYPTINVEINDLNKTFYNYELSMFQKNQSFNLTIYNFSTEFVGKTLKVSFKYNTLIKDKSNIKLSTNERTIDIDDY